MLMDGRTDEWTDIRMDGQTLLYRCEDASKKHKYCCFTPDATSSSFPFVVVVLIVPIVVPIFVVVVPISVVVVPIFVVVVPIFVVVVVDVLVVVLVVCYGFIVLIAHYQTDHPQKPRLLLFENDFNQHTHVQTD